MMQSGEGCYNRVRQMSVTLREAATLENNVIKMMMAVDVSHEKVLNAQAEDLASTTRLADHNEMTA